jgi:hypothetical protein
MLVWYVVEAKLYIDGVCRATGYSGLEECKNQPDLESVIGRGPIPRGRWILGPPVNYPTVLAIPLLPTTGTNTFKRTAFMIHGESWTHPGYSSHGCIIVSHDARVAILDGKYKYIDVITSIPVGMGDVHVAGD